MARGSRNPKSRTSAQGGSGQVRIISGRFRGRKLPVADLQGLRPTTDRVRETLFNWLQGDTQDARVLDCFAGSGALGLEALSRYADSVTLMELDKAAAAQLKRNLAALGADNARVIQGDTRTLLQQGGQPQNLVFVDPPFRQGLVAPVLALLEQENWLANDALIYVETESELSLEGIPSHWRLLKEKVAGQVAYRLFQRESE